MAQSNISPNSENTHIRPSTNKGFWPATNNDAILTALLQHEEYNFSKLTVENRSQKIRSKKWYTSSPRDDQLALALHRLEEDEVQNMDEKEQTIMRDDELTTIMQQQVEDEAQKLMDK